MKKLIFPFIILVILTGCTKEETPPEVTFTLSITGFNITTSDFGALKSNQADVFDSFSHKYSGGELHFEAPSGAIYVFDTNGQNMEGFAITLPVGTYTLSGHGGIADSRGTNAMTFNIPEQDVIINESTTSIDMTVSPTCALLLVADQSGLIDQAYIKRPNLDGTWNFATDGIFLFKYILPASTHVAYIKKTNLSELRINTGTLQVGYVYKVEVTDAEGNMILNFIPEMTDAETIVW